MQYFDPPADQQHAADAPPLAGVGELEKVQPLQLESAIGSVRRLGGRGGELARQAQLEPRTAGGGVGHPDRPPHLLHLVAGAGQPHAGTGPAVLDETFGRTHLGLSEHERIVGLVHLGSRGETPPERPRPDVAAKTSWLE